jgi:hypothetical protein
MTTKKPQTKRDDGDWLVLVLQAFLIGVVVGIVII